MTVLVTGATGNAGSAVVRALAAAGIPGRALVRKEVELPTGIEPVIGDLNRPDTFASGLAGVTGMFLLSGYERAEELLKNAADAGVRRIALLSSSSVVGTRTDNAIAAYHLAAEQAVTSSGMAWTFLRPNSFMTNTLRWLDQLRAGDEIRVQWPDVAVATIHPDDLAEVAVRALTEDGHERTAYRLTGPVALRPAEQVRILGEALGRPLRAYEMEDAETIAELRATMPEQYASAFESFYADGIIDETSVTDDVQRVTGHPPRTLEAWTQENKALFS
ncbi:uncharacterized protein YbjT (DUF2867 family) [Kribbella amoyensis]|uniref:Uncharacterized protein YbjT (DUF2867 family) n=1 Tax=Kribbella amoyensis TaxID=996641 RepID=A0A561BUH4_9ACTN|nr:NAD(P)H-binding protein [Kribbella amoyensis]TWD82432.1 uncharacterized protein YbjT (DUF2867 family) [Kribbella amoyensis]